MSAEQTDTPSLARAKAQARSDLLFALYTHAAQDLEAVQHDRDRLLGELVDTQRRLADSLGEVRRLTEIEQRHAALLGSTSWRVTAPVRALGRLVKRTPDGSGP